MLLPEIRDRRSIRHFQAVAVTPEQRAELLEAARLAPSSINLQPFRALMVSEPLDLDVVRRAAYGVGACQSAPLIVVCMADLDADRLVPGRVAELTEVGALEPMPQRPIVSGRGRPLALKLGREMALVNAAVATEHLVLQAQHMGLGTCWVHHFEHDEVREHFGIPTNLELLTLLAVGTPSQRPAVRPRIDTVQWLPPTPPTR